MAGKISTSRAAATIAATQTAEAKKKKRKQTRSTVLVDTATVSSDVETINVDDEEGDIIERNCGSVCGDNLTGQRHRKNRRWRRPARRQRQKSAPGRAPTRWATLSHARG
jgi:hypothetical protein